MSKENNTPDNHPVVQPTTSESNIGETGQTFLAWPFPTTPGDYYASSKTDGIRPEILEKIEQISKGKY